MSFLETLICICLISISALMSASEIALFSLSRFQLRALKERFKSQHRRIKRLLSDPPGLLITILITTEVVNIALAAIITHAVSQNGPASGELWLAHHGIPQWMVQIAWGTLITAPLVLFFCEITPKVVAARANSMVAPLSSGPLSAIYDAFKPVRVVLKHVIGTVARQVGRGEAGTFATMDAEALVLRENEFLSMIEEGQKEGAIQQTEVDLIKNVFHLDDTQASEITTPLGKVYSVPSGTTVKSALLNMRGRTFSRIPVTSTNRKQVIGLLYAKDLLFSRLDPELADSPVDELMRKPFTISPTMRLNVLFRRMKEQKIHLAVVESATGEALGIVTMDDILDELLEDLLVEDEEAAMKRRLL